MKLPGFTAETSLYRSGGSYCILAGAEGVTLPQPGALPRADGGRLRQLLRPLPGGTSCSPQCHLDATGACVQDCVRCPPGEPDGCDEFTRPCRLPTGCCPPDRDPCFS